jgi:hypothetical protein
LKVRLLVAFPLRFMLVLPLVLPLVLLANMPGVMLALSRVSSVDWLLSSPGAACRAQQCTEGGN